MAGTTERAGQEAWLGEAIRSLIAAPGVRQALDRIAAASLDVGKADGVYLERAYGRHDVEVVAVGGWSTPPAGTRVPYPGSLAARVIESGAPVLIADLVAEERLISRILAETCGDGSTGLVVPLIAEDEPIGALVLVRRAGRPAFDEEDARRLRDLADVAALALRRLLLLEDADRRRRGAEEREARFRELVANLREVVWTSEPGLARFHYISPGYETLFGRPIVRLCEDPRSFLEPIHPADRERVERVLTDRIREESDLEYRIIRPNGEIRWIQSKVYPILDERGGVRRIVGLSEDITIRQRREESHRFLSEATRVLFASLRYEETLQTVARLAADRVANWCIIFMVEDGQIRRLALAARDPALERRARELEGRYPVTPHHPVHQVLETGATQVLPELPSLPPDALHREGGDPLEFLRLFGIKSVILVAMIARNRTLGAIAFGSSEPERRYGPVDVALAEELAARAAVAIDNARLFRAAEEARGEAERRAREELALRQAAEAVSASLTVEAVIRQIAESSVVATNADGAVVERFDAERDELVVAAAAGDITVPYGARLPFRGTLAEHVLKQAKPELIAPLAKAGGTFTSALARSCPDCSALAIPLAGGGDAIGALILLRRPEKMPFRADEIERANTFGHLASLAFHKVRLLEESEARRRELVEVMESRSRLMRAFSHDVKNPLGAALGHAQLLEEGIMGALTEKQAESVARIRRTIDEARRLIDELIEVARTGIGQLPIERTEVDLLEAAREMVEEHRATAEAKGLALELRLPEALPPTESDATRIRQVLGNLLSNAVKYTSRGRITVAVTVRQDDGAPRPGRWIAVDVSDTGPGIPREKQHLLFQEYQRIEPGVERGAGLGLAMSQRIAQALGGAITVQSEAGKGSTFTFWIPLDGAGAARFARPETGWPRGRAR